MSNQIRINRTIFTNYKTGEKLYGFIVSNSYARDFCDTLDEVDLFLSDDDFIHVVLLNSCDKFNHETKEMIDYVRKNGCLLDGISYIPVKKF